MPRPRQSRSQRAVERTTDYERIAALPRRVIDPADGEAWARVFESEYRRPGSSMTLRWQQGLGLAELARVGGLWGALPVGVGKTLLTFLGPRVMNARRPILIMPANLHAKTFAAFEMLAKHFHAPQPWPELLSNQELSLESREDFLKRKNPDFIGIDEADEIANPQSALARRITRYVDSGAPCSVMALSGTPARKSLLNFWHLVMWVLKSKAPLPLKVSEARMWAMALDHIHPSARRAVEPGVLGDTLEEAREWLRLRLAETEGILILDGDSAEGIPLTLEIRPAKECPKIDAAFKRFLTAFESPGGEPVTDPLSRWRLDGWLGCGVFRYWDPPPEEPWRESRRASAKLVRDAIEASTTSKKPLDTEAQVLRRYASHPVVETWVRVKPTFRGSTKPAWISSATLETAVAWLREPGAIPSIVWCGGTDFAQALARATGLSYYGPEAVDQFGNQLHAADPRRHMIVSWNANKKGFDLQPWRRNAIFHPPQSAKWLEQIFGRSHRQGQTDPVTYTIFATSGGTYDMFEAAFGEAGFARSIVSLTQKLLRAKIVRVIPDKTPANQYRWARR